MDDTLPPWLNERLRWERPPGSSQLNGPYVLYWMHNALRAHENPALDVAICLSRQHQIPLLVYQGLCEKYPYASDRHHAFILQGARCVQRQLAARGIRYVFHLQHRGDRGPYLKKLVRDAALVVTEDVPVEPLVGWLERLSSTTETPLLTVDTSCVMPLPLLSKAYTRAFEFRRATEQEYAHRLPLEWTEQPVDCPQYDGPLPMQPLDLQDVDLAKLIGQCDIDHGIAPVTDTPGGTRAGYFRWETFKADGLQHYARRRNDAASQPSSRLSAYLHYGMVSPLRIAREAHLLCEQNQANSAGAKKFLDELLIWRELAHSFCYHHRHELDSFDALPEWAQNSLEEHAADHREVDYSWERLSRGHSDHPLWDACQRSLLKHGELHNNVRMTWGKAILPWVRSPHRALSMMIDLNHRYALDGRGACSYGGLLWCLGQFDRPFSPPQEILGTIRPRPLEEHVKRLDLQRFVKLVDRPITSFPATVAVIGAGVGGLVAARTLTDHGLDVTVFDKSRGVGGRLATRRAPSGVFFDHGAQYFTVRDGRFARYVSSWLERGLVQAWDGRIVEIRNGQVGAEKSEPIRYVGVPAMNSIAQHLAADIKLQRETRVATIQGQPGVWQLVADDGRELGTYDYVLLNCPPRQTLDLLPPGSVLAEQISSVEMDPCWAVLVELESPLELDFDAAFVHDSPLAWIARDSSKPGRPEGISWVMHASGTWSRNHLEEESDEVLAKLLDAFSDATGEMIGAPITLAAHRWRYAKPTRPLDQPCVWDAPHQLGVCGDWCGGPRLEGAFLSGQALAGALLRHLTIDRRVQSL